MSKKIFAIIIVLVIIVAGYYYLIKGQNSQSELQTTNTSSTASSTSDIRIPIQSLLSGNFISYSNKQDLTYTNQNTGTVVSFRGSVTQARNPGSNLYVNGKKVGEVEGQSFTSPTFSPDNKYFAFREMAVCGAGCFEFNIYGVDLTSGQIFFIKPPQRGYMNGTQYEVLPYIESYSWDGNAIKVRFFFVGLNTTGTYRISPIEIWNYDLARKQYNLVQTLPY